MERLLAVLNVFSRIALIFGLMLLLPIGVSWWIGDGVLTAFDEAFFGKTFDETDAAVVQRTVFGELDDADVNHLVRKGGRAQQEEQGSQQGSQLLHHNGVPSFPKSSFFIGTKNAPVVSD